MKNFSFLFALVILFGVFFSETVSAQNVPEARALDENGVNLLTGQMEGSIPIVSIGEGNGSLAHSVSLFGLGGINVNASGYIGIDANASNGEYSYSVILPGSSNLRFTATTNSPSASTNFTEYSARGNSLIYTGSEYKLTGRDGAIALFSGSTRYLTSIELPDGTKTSYHRVGSSLSSITNNLGYQLKYQNSGTGKRKVTAINNRFEFCSPTAATCSVGSQWSWGDGPVLNTGVYQDAEGRTYTTQQQNFPNTSVLIMQAPGTGNNYFVANYTGGDLVTGVRNGIANNYSTSTNDMGTPNNDEDDERTTNVTLPGGGTRTVKSKVKGNLILSDKNVLGQTTSYAYNTDNLVSMITFPRGDTIQYSYDSRGNVTETRRSAGTGGGGSDLVTSASYPSSCTTSNFKYCNKPTYTIDTAGERTDYKYHTQSGQIWQVIRPDAGQGRPKTVISYQQYRAKVKNSSGALYDAAPVWKPVYVRNLYGTSQQTVTTYIYDVQKNLTPKSMRTVRGGITHWSYFTYDNYGNLITSNGPLSGTDDVVTTRYDKLRRPTGTIGGDPDGNGPMLRAASITTYDLSGAVSKTEAGTATIYGLGGFSTFNAIQSQHNVLDNYARTLASYVQAGNSYYAHMDYSYDNRGRVVCTAVRMNASAFNGTHTDGCTATTAGPFGPDRISKRTYDVAGRITSTTSAFGTSAASTTNMAYYSYGPLMHVHDGKGNKTYYTYDGFNRSKAVYYPKVSGTGHNTADYELYSYDNAGRQHLTRQRDGQTASRSYDELGRITFINAPGSSEDTTFTYDIEGKPLTVSKTGQTLTYAYDNAGRLTSETSSLGSVSYQYDSFNRRTRMDYPGAGGFYLTYQYLSGGLLASIKEKGSTTLASYTYDNQGRRKTVTRGTSNNVTTYNYDGISRLTSLNNNLAGTTMDQTLSFTYTPSGQTATQSNSNPTYDATATTYTNNFVINGLNQIDSKNGSLFTYDTAGNMKTGGGNSYNYDYVNRLTSVAGKGTVSYDPVSRLKSLTSGGVTTSFIYDGQDMIAEFNGTTVMKRYVHGPSVNEPLVEYTGSGTSNKKWLVSDVRGSITSHTNSSGTSVATNKYDIYGQPQSGNQGRFQYAGQVWFEELDLYYNRARFYDPTIRRFLTADPIGYGDGMNMYAYVSGDPINKTDPSGLCGLTANYSTRSWSTTSSNSDGSNPTTIRGTSRYFSGFSYSSCGGPGLPGFDGYPSINIVPYMLNFLGSSIGGKVDGGDCDEFESEEELVDAFADYIESLGVLRTDPTSPFRVAKIANKYSELPKFVRSPNYSSNFSRVVGRLGAHLPLHQNVRLEGTGLHISGELIDQGRTASMVYNRAGHSINYSVKSHRGLFVHHDVFDPTTSLGNLYRHNKEEVPGATSQFDDETPLWKDVCGGF